MSPVSVNTYLRHIKSFYLWQGKSWKLDRLREEQKILATFTRDQVRQLMAYRPTGVNMTRAWTVAAILLDTGLRIAECLNVRKEDIDFDQMTVRVVGKGNKHRLVPMSPEGRKRLFIYLRTHSFRYVFGTQAGTRMSERNFLRDFKAVCTAAGIAGVRTSPHTLRHSFAVYYLRNGGNLEFLRRILGHSSILTTQKYLRSLGVEDLQAVHNELSMLSARR
ncbi:MAG TPA: tyrosine-type recombinase/integrase [Bryobacteraceae bacterium]|nr:tyrosine-type recombinase/integrase [Bryobacteraceae bacterium]